MYLKWHLLQNIVTNYVQLSSSFLRATYSSLSFFMVLLYVIWRVLQNMDFFYFLLSLVTQNLAYTNTPSLHISLNCRWISIGFMPRKWRNRIITRCSSNVNVAISVSKTQLQLDLVTSIQRVVQCCHFASPNLKNSHVSSNNFHVSICFHSREKKLGYLRTWKPHV